MSQKYGRLKDEPVKKKYISNVYLTYTSSHVPTSLYIQKFDADAAEKRPHPENQKRFPPRKTLPKGWVVETR